MRPIAQIYPDAVSVRMFVRSDFRIVKGEVRYAKRWLNPRGGFRLTADQQRRLRAALRDAPTPETSAACFIPHHYFRFYDKSDHQIGEVAVCFCCGGAQASPRLVAEDRIVAANLTKVGQIVTELGATTKTDCEVD